VGKSGLAAAVILADLISKRAGDGNFALNA